MSPSWPSDLAYAHVELTQASIPSRLLISAWAALSHHLRNADCCIYRQDFGSGGRSSRCRRPSSGSCSGTLERPGATLCGSAINLAAAKLTAVVTCYVVKRAERGAAYLRVRLPDSMLESSSSGLSACSALLRFLSGTLAPSGTTSQPLGRSLTLSLMPSALAFPRP